MKILMRNEKHSTNLILENLKNGISYRISKPTFQNKNSKLSGYAKFIYYPSVQDPDDLSNFEELLVFNINEMNEQDVKRIFNYINDCLENDGINSIKDCIKYIQKTFGKVLGYTKEKVLGKIGELLFVKKCLTHNIDLTNSFFIKENSLFDFYILFNEKYLEVKTIATESLSIKLNIKQLTYKPDATFFGVVKIKEDENGTRLIDLVDEILLIKNINYEFKSHLNSLRNNILEDIFCEEVKFDHENILYFLYLENVIQNEISILNLLNDENNWNHIEKIQLTINLSGIKTSSFEDLKNKIGAINERNY